MDLYLGDFHTVPHEESLGLLSVIEDIIREQNL